MNVKATFAMMLAAASMAFSPLAAAQEAAELPQIEAEEVSAGQVVSFVNALIALERLRFEYQSKIEAAETEDERAALAEEADGKAREAVDKTAGITAAEYLAIGRAAQGSEELTDRIEARLMELREKQQRRAPLESQQSGAETGETETQ